MYNICTIYVHNTLSLCICCQSHPMYYIKANINLHTLLHIYFAYSVSYMIYEYIYNMSPHRKALLTCKTKVSRKQKKQTKNIIKTALFQLISFPNRNNNTSLTKLVLPTEVLRFDLIDLT